jgi:hypothetical protein
MQLFLKNTQTVSGTGGQVYDLDTVQGSPTTLNTGLVSSFSFVKVLEFRYEIIDPPPETIPVSVSINSVLSSNLEIRWRVVRFNSSNILQETSGYSNNYNSIGVKTDTLSLTASWSAGDFIALEMELRKVSGAGSVSVQLDINDPNSFLLAEPEGSGSEEESSSGGSETSEGSFEGSESGSEGSEGPSDSGSEEMPSGGSDGSGGFEGSGGGGSDGLEETGVCNLDQRISPSIKFDDIVWRQDVFLTEPILISPRPQATFCLEAGPYSPSGIVLRWHPVPNATTYLVQWANNPQISGPTVREAVVTGLTEYQLFRNTDIRLGETIYWRIQAANLTLGGVSPKSEIRSITYNCGTNDGSEPATSCKSFDVELELRGSDRLVGFESASYWLEASFASADNIGRPILCISGIDWDVKSNPEDNLDARVVRVENNGFKALVRVGRGKTQVIELTATVTFKDLIKNECFTCAASKLISVDQDGNHWPIVKFKLLEALPQCSEAAAVLFEEDLIEENQFGPIDGSGSGDCGCRDFGESDQQSESNEKDCCQESDDIITVYDVLGIAKTSAENSRGFTPENSVGFAVRKCGRFEVLNVGEGCCLSQSGSESSDSDSDSTSTCDVDIIETRVTPNDRCVIVEQRTRTIYLENGCLKSTEGEWEFVEELATCDALKDCCDSSGSGSSGSGSTCEDFCLRFEGFECDDQQPEELSICVTSMSMSPNPACDGQNMTITFTITNNAGFEIVPDVDNPIYFAYEKPTCAGTVFNAVSASPPWVSKTGASFIYDEMLTWHTSIPNGESREFSVTFEATCCTGPGINLEIAYTLGHRTFAAIACEDCNPPI